MAQKPATSQDPNRRKNADGPSGNLEPRFSVAGPEGPSSYLSRLMERFYASGMPSARQKRGSNSEGSKGRRPITRDGQRGQSAEDRGKSADGGPGIQVRNAKWRVGSGK